MVAIGNTQGVIVENSEAFIGLMAGTVKALKGKPVLILEFIKIDFLHFGFRKGGFVMFVGRVAGPHAGKGKGFADQEKMGWKMHRQEIGDSSFIPALSY